MSGSMAADVWRVEVKFQGVSMSLVGKLPAEKRHYLKDFPKKLSVSTKTKYSAVPGTSFFCKFASKDASELLAYLKRKRMALCVSFPYAKYIFTLHLVAPVDLHQLKSLQRLKRTGASVESLCRDDDGVVIGVISKEINKEIEDKLLQKKQSLAEAAVKAKTLSTSLNDPLLELDMLLERLPETKSAIEICMRFILKQEHGFDSIWRRILAATEALEHNKGKLNVIFLAHEVFRKVRGGTNDEHGNSRLASSPLVVASEKVLYQLLDLMDDDWKELTVVREILVLWEKWHIPFKRPTMALDLPFESLANSTASSSPISDLPSSASPQVAELMRKHNITPGAWEIYLSRANEDELYEIDHVLTLNEANRRYWTDQFLHRYVKKNFKQLIDTHHTSVEPEHMRTSGEVMQEALACTWDFDAEATKSIFHSDACLIDELWRKLEARMPCDNLNAYVMSYLKRCNHTLYSQNPDFNKLVAVVEAFGDVDLGEVKRLLGVVWTLSERANTALDDLIDDRLLTVARTAVAAAKDGKALNVSRLITFHFSKQIKTSTKGKWWSPRMKSTIHEAYKRSAKTEAKQMHLVKETPPELTDEELAALKASIPKPPPLKFTKVKLKDIQRTESNINGTMGMAISGIPNSGRGMFNLSKHPWPAFSVVCIFGSRRISEEMHHDGLNKVARCGEVGETFVVVNGEVKEVDRFVEQYGHRLVEYDGLVDAEGSMGGFPNDRVYEYPEDIYWDASGFYNNSILCPGCIVDPTKPDSKIVLDQLYVVTWKEVPPMHEFFLAYGTSYYEDDASTPNDDGPKKKAIKR
ncbi:hypothetical protein SPRG_03550 [Saprolegnia parasitica CBS 223.65]|uniref:CID domain-containing protein n=1 Tax=Saprolegnia parasitica (strain CBS 223.65) TaxID=695850 RepID=A0A067CQW8_SAPPC|nr:hypothetical protein SPRG_03550 [Saprolegnia parasitica CBS 223.65]KDO31630.1 hypothetical protein SPRG_03550 [Saprolegnia parasitica CBS 223.65]|eukprot:XP_012197520.1 hypothetical protein SPRG_03550 [Saprolegnia parasitica CBS 223.65]